MSPEWVWRDQWLGVVSKPPGVPVQRSRRGIEGTLEAWLAADPDVGYSALHHRLDAAAQGLVAIALDRKSNSGLAAAFRNRTAVRLYRVLVHRGPVGEEGVWEHAEGTDRGERVALVPGAPGAGRPMRSSWRLVERRRTKALLEIRLHTGRTHQIRLQAAAEGCPVVGDVPYGFGEAGGLRLQAYHLALKHPVTSEPLSWELPEPEGW